MSATARHWKLPGSIRPPAHKRQSLKEGIRTVSLAPRLVIPLTQPDFSEPELCAAPGQKVLKGQLLARGSGSTSLYCHASTSGTLVDFSQEAIPNASGLSELCAILESDGEDRWLKQQALPDYRSLSPEILIARIEEAGISGLGGAGFPTHVKLRAAQGKVHTLVINACECEPWITSDEALMREQAPDILNGILILLHILAATRCLIGIEDSKPAAIRALQAAIADPRIELRVLPAQYPSGAEKQLIYMLSGSEIPSGTLPIDSGFLCHNVATARAVSRAVLQGEALVSRVTTITGDAVHRPGNLDVPIGTPLSHLLRECQVDEFSLRRLVMGGSLMGIELPHAELPALKTTNCIIAASLEELPLPEPEEACIRCGFCSEVCPAALLPQQLYWFARGRDWDRLTQHNLVDCIECGACAYVCPSHIPLVQYYRAAKGEIADIREKKRMADHSRQRFEFHQARKAQEHIEEELRRAERAELAKQKLESPEGSAAQAAIAAALARVKAKKSAQNSDAPADSQDEKP